MEDDGGNPILTSVDKELRLAQHKILQHFKTAYGITPKKVSSVKNFI